MKKILLGVMLLGMITMGASQQALANTMIFHIISMPLVDSYNEDGIYFSRSSGAWYVGNWGDAPTPNLHTNGGVGFFDMGGTVFDLLSFDLNTNWNFNDGIFGTWVTTSSSGGYFALPGEDWGGDSTHIDFKDIPGFSGITFFQFSGGGDLGVDNITTAASSVPEPTTMLLLGLGLIGLAGVRRKMQI